MGQNVFPDCILNGKIVVCVVGILLALRIDVDNKSSQNQKPKMWRSAE